ncbi:MAG: GntR family transcriptional regulator [Lysobacterales bacterium]|jgi:DNA-binding GntR family transcriptional regulator
MTGVENHPPSRNSLAERAYRALEEKIVTLRLHPGELLVEKDLVETTGIGRTPVREAVQRLANEGLMQVLPRKGLMVTSLRRTDLARALEARKVLERMLVVKAAERATADQRQALQVLAAHIDAAGADLEGFLRLEFRLGELLGSASHNQYLIQGLAAMYSQCRRLWYLHRSQSDLLRATRLHGTLARAVAEGSGAGAVRALDEIMAILENLVSRLDILS